MVLNYSLTFWIFYKNLELNYILIHLCLCYDQLVLEGVRAFITVVPIRKFCSNIIQSAAYKNRHKVYYCEWPFMVFQNLA